MIFEGKQMTEIRDESKFWAATFNIWSSQKIITCNIITFFLAKKNFLNGVHFSVTEKIFNALRLKNFFLPEKM
jgi:hypothetical protein